MTTIELHTQLENRIRDVYEPDVQNLKNTLSYLMDEGIVEDFEYHPEADPEEWAGPGDANDGVFEVAVSDGYDGTEHHHIAEILADCGIWSYVRPW